MFRVYSFFVLFYQVAKLLGTNVHIILPDLILLLNDDSIEVRFVKFIQTEHLVVLFSG